MIKSGKYLTSNSLVVRLLMASALAFVVAACAGTPPPPTQALQAAQLAITSAEQDRVADYSPQELRQAHDKLSAARLAVQREDMVLAAQLAHESRVVAELSSAKTASMKAKAINDEMQRSINDLQQEIQRNSGGSQ